MTELFVEVSFSCLALAFAVGMALPWIMILGAPPLMLLGGLSMFGMALYELRTKPGDQEAGDDLSIDEVEEDSSPVSIRSLREMRERERRTRTTPLSGTSYAQSGRF